MGGGFDFIFDYDNVLALRGEFNKLLVPTPQDFNGDGVIDASDNEEYQNIGWFEGIFKSFGDAPDGFSEELKEITWALGAEYIFREAFMLRAGYFNESEEKGFRKFFSLGAGFVYKNAQIDLLPDNDYEFLEPLLSTQCALISGAENRNVKQHVQLLQKWLTVATQAKRFQVLIIVLLRLFI